MAIRWGRSGERIQARSGLHLGKGRIQRGKRIREKEGGVECRRMINLCDENARDNERR